MAKDGDETLIASVTSHYATARRLFTRSSSFLADATFAIRQGTPDQTIAALSEKCALSDADRQKLADLCARKGGAGFLAEKVADMNREAFHRSAFALNALVQLLCVDLGAQFSVSLPQLKFLLVFMNLFLAMVAHYARRKRLRELIAGPSRLPSRRRCFGMLPNKAYNKAVKRSSRPFAQAAWRENSVYKPAYYLNAATLSSAPSSSSRRRSSSSLSASCSARSSACSPRWRWPSTFGAASEPRRIRAGRGRGRSRSIATSIFDERARRRGRAHALSWQL